MANLLIQLNVVLLPARVMPTRMMQFFLICIIRRSPRSSTVKRLLLSSAAEVALSIIYLYLIQQRSVLIRTIRISNNNKIKHYCPTCGVRPKWSDFLEFFLENGEGGLRAFGGGRLDDVDHVFVVVLEHAQAVFQQVSAVLGLVEVEIDEIEGDPEGKRWMDEVIDHQEEQEEEEGILQALFGELVDEPVEAN